LPGLYGNSMKIAVMTLGCRTNQAESARIEERLRASGHTTVASINEADVVVINSCTVTASADRQTRQLVARTIKSHARVILTGCYSELNRKGIAEAPDITIVGNDRKYDIADLLPKSDIQVSGKSVIRRHRPIIKIQDGCNNSCSYCIIPLARGRSRSVNADEVISEVRKYEQAGFQEVVLSGIHLGVYGLDMSPASNLEKLLLRIISETDIYRIRLSSIELSEVTDGILDLIKTGRVCNHLHIPLQGGTDNLLANMRRSYTIDEYKRGIDRISSVIPNIAIGADIIVGFPGESEDEFMRSIANVSEMPLSYMHVFPFSRRDGSSAGMMSDQVHDSLKKMRVRQMLDLASSKRVNFISGNVGLSHEVIVETVKDGLISGATSNYIKVSVKIQIPVSPGMLIKTQITEGYASSALGIPLN